jgi:hypothetical protein
VRRHGAAAPFLSALDALAAAVPQDQAGVRLYNVPGLAELLASTALGAGAAERLGATARPVRAILFGKNAATNWSLGWHQDRTIAVKARADVTGYGPWSIKAGMQHVESPFSLIERMVTIRVHLDPVPDDNAPLLVAPGSHMLGRIPEPALADIVARCGTALCLADRGDVWIYATPIVHASAAATPGARRRVLQVDFSADVLPVGLEWLGV